MFIGDCQSKLRPRFGTPLGIRTKGHHIDRGPRIDGTNASFRARSLGRPRYEGHRSPLVVGDSKHLWSSKRKNLLDLGNKMSRGALTPKMGDFC